MSAPTLPFRFVTFGDGAPYPVHEQLHHVDRQQPFMVDLLSGDAYDRGGVLRQPAPEDFLRQLHPLPAPLVEDHDSDQEIEIIEPDSYLDHAAVVKAKDTLGVEPNGSRRHSTIAASKPLSMSHPDAGPQRSRSELDRPSRMLHQDSEQDSDVGSTPQRVPTIGNDMFSPVLGGLHRLHSVPVRKESKMGRLKRFFSFRKKRQYGRRSSR
ncbi:hypothetical protein FB567DRAFT_440157 [Paraphoma chrysanthemicola]|uniref:Uncharacterized protein n=1 Tax=Paraphoma chrysanthemicola TaxID=798071 RepID=A0A8K0R7C5_9PLEO|nr:hypothetical protein FB567DRAFT_440157 [Paraphoma chrysanthemicola]